MKIQPMLHFSDDLALPIDTVTQKLAFLGRTGSGKTYAATKLAEEMLRASAQVVALDPVGVWYGLRLGRGAAKIHILGGLHGDVALEPAAGAVVADMVVDRGLSVVLDTSTMLDPEKARFAGAFARQFFLRKKSRPSAVHLFIEECQEYAPQNYQPGEQAMLHEFERLVKIGRNFGVGISLISQRPQEVNKKVLNQTECLFAFQMTGPQERKAISAWTADKGVPDDVGDALPGLEIGQAHVWSPQWLRVSKTIRVARKQSLDVSSTPVVGEAAAQVSLSKIDLEQLRADMAATIEKAKANDPQELRRRIAELERRLKTSPQSALASVEVPMFDKELFDALGRTLTEQFAEARKDIEKSVDAIDTRIHLAVNNFRGAMHVYMSKTLDKNDAKSGWGGAPRKTQAPSRGHAVKISHEVTAKMTGPGTDMETMDRRLLTALAQYPQGRMRAQVLTLASYVTCGPVSKAFARLKTAGWIEGERGAPMKITSAGLMALGSFTPLPTGDALVEHWLAKLDTMPSKILRVLVNHRGEVLSRRDLLEKAGYAPCGPVSKAIGMLCRLELVTGERGVGLQLNEEMFS